MTKDQSKDQSKDPSFDALDAAVNAALSPHDPALVPEPILPMGGVTEDTHVAPRLSERTRREQEAGAKRLALYR